MILISIINSQNCSQIIPIVFEFKEKVSKHIVISDEKEEDTKKSQEFYNSIQKLYQKYSLHCDIERIVLDEDSKKNINETLQYLSKLQEPLFLNASDADLTLIIYISNLILQYDGKVIAYDKSDNSYNLITKNSFTNHNVLNNMKIDDFLTLMGEKYIDETDKQAIRKNKDNLYTIFYDAKRMFKIRDLIRKNRYDIIKQNYLEIYRSLKKVGMLRHTQQQDYTNFGNLFEQFVFLHLDRLDYDDIATGIKIEFEQDGENIVSNEFDILSIKNNQFGIIECKIGNRMDPLSTIYKSDALMEYFGADSHSLIISIQQNFTPHDKLPKKLFSENLKLRASANHIDIFNAFDLGKNKFYTQIKKTFNVKKRVFLLGGSDLEMQEIKKLLELTNQDYLDKELSWGAKLSEYEDHFNNYDHFYAIELTIDTKVPRNFTLIDHHNEHSHKKSAIEQICEILDIKMTRYQTMVAINDTEHIKGLKEFGATQAEIKEIRHQERAIQGVSKDDELDAQRAILKQKKVDDIIIIKSHNDKFTPISDILYDKNIIIYNKSKLFYSGRDVKKLVEKFQKKIAKQKAYYGGKNFGFFGIAKDCFKEEELSKILDTLT